VRLCFFFLWWPLFASVLLREESKVYFYTFWKEEPFVKSKALFIEKKSITFFFYIICTHHFKTIHASFVPQS